MTEDMSTVFSRSQQSYRNQFRYYILPHPIPNSNIKSCEPSSFAANRVFCVAKFGIWGDNFMTFCINKYDYDSWRVEQPALTLHLAYMDYKQDNFPSTQLTLSLSHGLVISDESLQSQDCKWREEVESNHHMLFARHSTQPKKLILMLHLSLFETEKLHQPKYWLFLKWKREKTDEELTKSVLLDSPFPVPIRIEINSFNDYNDD